MIKSLFVSAALAFCFLLPGAFGQAGAAFAVKAINVATPKTPEPSGGEIKRYTAGTWIEVETEFSSTAPLTPELQLKYFVLIGGQCLVADVTHVNVPAGGSLFSAVYIAPRTIATLLKGAPFTAASIQNVAVQIMRPGAPQPLAERLLKPGPPFYRTMQQVPNMVLNKADTPFAHYWWDRYEATKASR